MNRIKVVRGPRLEVDDFVEIPEPSGRLLEWRDRGRAANAITVNIEAALGPEGEIRLSSEGRPGLLECLIPLHTPLSGDPPPACGPQAGSVALLPEGRPFRKAPYPHYTLTVDRIVRLHAGLLIVVEPDTGEWLRYGRHLSFQANGERLLSIWLNYEAYAG